MRAGYAPGSRKLTIRMRKLLLFDLDGTLLLTHGAGVRAMQLAGLQVWGQHFSLEGLIFGGSLDPIIVGEALTRQGLPLEEEAHARFRHLYQLELLKALSEPEQVEVLPGVHALLEMTRSHERSILGLLTGNYAETGVVKLEAAAIDPNWFHLKVWGDSAPTRPSMVALALEQVRLLHSGLDSKDVFVIGDTPRDIDCAKKNGCHAIAVATGNYARSELAQAGADLVLENLAEPAALLEHIHRPN